MTPASPSAAARAAPTGPRRPDRGSPASAGAGRGRASRSTTTAAICRLSCSARCAARPEITVFGGNLTGLLPVPEYRSRTAFASRRNALIHGSRATSRAVRNGDKKCLNRRTSTNARWRSPRSRSDRSRRCTSRRRRAITRSGTPTRPATTRRSIRPSTRRWRKNGTLTDADLDQVYSTYISPTRFSDKIDNVGTRVMDEINQVMAMMDAAVGSASSYTESLTSVSDKLGNSKDRESLRAIVESLVATANEMKQNNHALEAAAQRVEGRDQSAPGKSRGRPHREPDRSAHLARQPQALRRKPGAGDRRIRPSAANRCRW